jgi:tRNA-dihydrouridine synthase 3
VENRPVPMALLDQMLPGALVMAPMTKGSNLPYRRLCAELGARVLVSEMVVARRLKQRRRGEFALVRRAPGEPCFGVQLAGNQPDEVAWAAALAEARGADFIDLNLGCPIDHFTRKGLGAALARQPGRVRKIVEAMRSAVRVPVTVKIRLGWNADHRNYLTLAQGAVDGGAAALTVHGRTREARYRHPADWDAIAEVAARLPVPVVGNGDVLFGHDALERCRQTGCIAVMTARGALMRPWIFRELSGGYQDITIEERIAIYRRYVALAVDHWSPRPHAAAVFGDGLPDRGTPPSLLPAPDGVDAGRVASPLDSSGKLPSDQSVVPTGSESSAPIDNYGLVRVREFLRWHVGFWVRAMGRRPDGTWPTMQQREPASRELPPLEGLFTRTDDASVDYITDELLHGGDFRRPPAAAPTGAAPEITEAG